MKFYAHVKHWVTACLLLVVVAAGTFVAPTGSRTQNATPEKSLSAPRDLKVAVKMIGPVTQTTELQIICVLKHNPAGDKYIEAMQDFNNKLGGVLSSLRERGEFVGEPGETLLFTPPAGSITPKKVLLIGVGEESALSLDRLRLAGTIAAREAVRLGMAHVSFAPTLRDQGSSRIDVGEGDAAVAASFLLAYDTELRLQEQGLASGAKIGEFVIEAGPQYFAEAAEKVGAAVQSAAAALARREAKPYRHTSAQ
ncbi:MAG TPA: M17 family peptidase N-terminal domain-containing protein [Candidatus Binatia bacterium]|nr:M17 family peptidase N-terminal domain-containing protein [Candidatus Binatia bacterium]